MVQNKKGRKQELRNGILVDMRASQKAAASECTLPLVCKTSPTAKTLRVLTAFVYYGLFIENVQVKILVYERPFKS